MSRLLSGWACLLAALLGPSVSLRAAEWDAMYVKMEVPNTVAADQVFAVKITFQNTGTQTWLEGLDLVPSSLHSEDPVNNTIWGTNFIIQGQGTKVAPGQQFTYVSQLRSPSEPGKYGFRWRVHGANGAFGEATPKFEVTVTKQEGPSDKPPTIPAADPNGKRPLTFDDFEYLGSFKLPESSGKGGAGFSESGLALRATRGGKRLLINYTHPEGSLFEVEIPPVAKFEKGDATKLKTAKAMTTWGTLLNKDKSGPNGGFVYDEGSKLLYWSFYHHYWAGGDLPVLNATKLQDDGTTEFVASWTVPRQKWHWGGVTRLPKSFADKYTEGATLALGFGGYFSIVAPCSRGPALSAIATPDPKKGKIDPLINLLGYPEPTAAARPGDYFNVNCGFWAEQPKSRAVGTWTFCDHCRAGVLIDLPDVQGYIAFAKLGTGRLGYDYGSISNAAETQHWYFYDTRQMGEVAKATRQLGTAMPYLTRLESGMGGLATGACFDEDDRKLYVLRTSAHAVGREFHPLVHVYRVKK